MKRVHRELVQLVTDRYLGSHDFNGLSAQSLRDALNVPPDDFTALLAELIETGAVDLVHSQNPHILSFAPLPRNEQLSRLRRDPSWGGCLYPSKRRLVQVVDRPKYTGRPYSLRIALGAHQLKHVPFDLVVLERYINDPRYHFVSDDVGGRLAIRDHAQHPSTDDIYTRFGFCFDSADRRALAVYLGDLRKLSGRNQRLWEAHELPGHYDLHPDFYRRSILGQWGQGISIFHAFGEALAQVNDICELIGWQRLFKLDFRRGERPREFRFLLRPTRREYDEFLQLLQKLMSDNLNMDFFGPEIARVELRSDGTSQRKGSIRLLESWLTLHFRLEDESAIPTVVRVFREVRELRSKPAHSIGRDEYDGRFHELQRDLMWRAFEAIATLRTILMVHPQGATYELPDWWQSVRIWKM